MQFDLFITPLALSGTEDAYDFYETKSEGLGDRFIESLETTQRLSFRSYISSIRE